MLEIWLFIKLLYLPTNNDTSVLNESFREHVIMFLTHICQCTYAHTHTLTISWWEAWSCKKLLFLWKILKGVMISLAVATIFNELIQVEKLIEQGQYCEWLVSLPFYFLLSFPFFFFAIRKKLFEVILKKQDKENQAFFTKWCIFPYFTVSR